MKRLFTMLLTICMMFSFAFTQNIYADSVKEEYDYRNLLNGDNHMINHFTVDNNGVIYVSIDDGKLAKYDVESQKIGEVINAKVSDNNFAVKDNKLYILNEKNINTLDLATGESTNIEYNKGESYINNFTLVNDGIVFLKSDYDTGAYEYVSYMDKEYKYSVDLCTEVFAAYNDGRILTKVYVKDSDGNMRQKFAIVNKDNIEYIDLQEPEEGFGFEVLSFYDRAKDKMYLFANSFLYEYDSNFKIVRRLLFNESNNRQMIIDNDKIILVNDEANNLEFVDINSLTKPDKVLKISGYISDDIIKKYNNTNPDRVVVPVNQGDERNLYDIKLLAENMKINAADIYITSLDGNLNLLAKQEYVSPLDASEKINANISRMYPFIQDVIKYNDKIFGIPYDLSMPIFKIQYNKAILEDIGMSEEDLPKDIVELISFMKKAKETMENFPEYTVVEGEMDSFYIVNLLEQFINGMCVYQTKNNMPLKINIPENIEMFEKVLDYGIKQLGNETGINAMGDTQNKALIKSINFGYNPTKDSDNVLLNLNLYKDIPLYQSLSARCFVLNSFSECKDDALKFFEWLLENMDEDNQARIYADFDKEINDQSALERVVKLESNLKILEEEKSKTDNENEKKAIDRGIEEIKGDIEYFKNNSVILSKEDLDYYKSKVEYYYIPKRVFLNYQNESVMNILMEIFTGKVQSVDVLNNLDNIVQMDMLEGQ